MLLKKPESHTCFWILWSVILDPQVVERTLQNWTQVFLGCG